MDPTDASGKDDTLPQRILAGDSTAYMEFAHRFSNRFRRYFLFKGIPGFEAEDLARTLVTDILLKVLRFRQQQGTRFDDWVLAIMRNAAVNWYRTRKPVEPLDRVRLPTHSPAPFRNDTTPDEMPGPELTAVHEALELLSPVYRLMIDLRDMGEERSFAEIGQVLGITENNARQRYARARTSLRGILQEDPRLRHRLNRASACPSSV